MRVWWKERCFFIGFVSSAVGKVGDGTKFPWGLFGRFCIEIAFFKVRVGLNSLRDVGTLDGESCTLRHRSFEGEQGRLLVVLLESLSRRTSRRCPSGTMVSNLDEVDDAKDRLDEDEAGEGGVCSGKAGSRENSARRALSGAGGSSMAGGAVGGRKQ